MAKAAGDGSNSSSLSIVEIVRNAVNTFLGSILVSTFLILKEEIHFFCRNYLLSLALSFYMPPIFPSA